MPIFAETPLVSFKIVIVFAKPYDICLTRLEALRVYSKVDPNFRHHPYIYLSSKPLAWPPH